MSSSERNRLATRDHPDEDGMMVKEIIYGRLNLSRGMLRRMKQGGGVFLNGKRDFITRRVRAGDVIEVVFFDEKTALVGESIPLHVVYEDDFLLAVDKSLVCPCTLRHYLRTSPGSSSLFRVGLSTIRLVHRLDKDTSGWLSGERALYSGEPDQGSGTGVPGSGGRHCSRRRVTSSCPSAVEGRVSSVRQPVSRRKYEVIRRGNWSLVRLTLALAGPIKSGCIRVGHPLVGDAVYGRPAQDCPRQALHAWRLSFVHPRTGEDVNLRVPIPHDMRLLLQQEILILM